MRFLIIILVAAVVSCGGFSHSYSVEKSVVGSWKIMGMTKKPFPIEKITETDLMCGNFIFNEDKSFEGEIVYPRMPDKNVKFVGTYIIENGNLIINNQSNNSTTESTLKFEKDFMIATPLNPNGSIMYLKRIDQDGR